MALCQHIILVLGLKVTAGEPPQKNNECGSNGEDRMGKYIRTPKYPVPRIRQWTSYWYTVKRQGSLLAKKGKQTRRYNEDNLEKSGPPQQTHHRASDFSVFLIQRNNTAVRFGAARFFL